LLPVFQFGKHHHRRGCAYNASFGVFVNGFSNGVPVRFDPRVGVALEPGLGQGWARVAGALAEKIVPADIEGIWLFPPVRREEREWGVAVISCGKDDNRSRIFTASYMMIVRGREKGHGKVAVEEVGESPVTVLEDVLRGVRERAGEVDPPTEITPDLWFGEASSE
jgi:hypothetical protein